MSSYTFDVPVHFHDLGMHLDDDQRAVHLRELACEIWAGGTEAQRAGVQQFYGELADAAAEDGASYAGVCLMATEDDRVSTASLVARSETLEPAADPEAVIETLEEVLSLDPAADVHRTETEQGPAVVAFSGVEWTPVPEQPALPLVRMDVYLPLPEISELLVFSLTTPSLPDLPEYVALLSELTDTVEVLTDDPAPLPVQRPAERVPLF
ncbi:hypothetical protein [Kitasatospora sp. NPDC048407]|uniref:hypothetical protein n=1 Tax=Kitasatospora sp. NPDC048407 TaxID=3364051 RepID=UPI003724B277